MSVWRLLDFEFDDPSLNMALEEAVALNVGAHKSPNTIRFWRNDPSIMVGCYQSVDLEVNLHVWKKNRIPIVRRFTGGGTVYHDRGNLNYSIAVKILKDQKPDLSVSTIKFSKGIIEALQRLGITSCLDGRNIVINGKKVSGSAGCIRGGSLFHHGTLLIDSNLASFDKILEENTSRKTIKKYVRSSRMPVTTISNELRNPISLDKIKHLLKETFESTLLVKLKSDLPTERELKEATILHSEKYSRIEWNLRL